MTHLKKLVFNSFQVNTYILYDETKECIIIDPACYSEEENHVLEGFISENNLTPVLSLFTHCHIDHILGMKFVKKRYDTPLYAHELELKSLENAPLMGDLFGFSVDSVPALDKYITPGEMLNFGNSNLRALHVPGHSQGSLAFYVESDSIVITGDALFSGSIGRTDLPGGDYDTLINAILTKLFPLPGKTSVWPGHGESSSILDEINNNPFFSDYKT